MKKKENTLNTLLAIILGVILLVALLIRAFAPAVIIPKLDVSNLTAISLLALVANHYVGSREKRSHLSILIFGGITFGLLPFSAGFCYGWEALKLGIAGGFILTLLTWLYDQMLDRLSTGSASKIAPILCAFMLYLASQCVMGFTI